MPLTPHARISRWLCVQQRLLILHRSAQGQGRGNLPNSYKFSRAFGFKQARKLNRAYASSHAVETGQEWPYLRPLLLAFFASQQRSAFAAKSLVQTAIELFQQGTAWSDIQLELKLAGIREGEQIEKLDPQEQKKARLLVNLEKDVLLQWIGLIFMTLDELHVLKSLSGKSPLQDSSQMVKGMRGFVRHTLSLGFDSQRLQLQQQIVLDEKGEALPSVKLMQENARLIVLTKEIADQLRKESPETSGNRKSEDDDQLEASKSTETDKGEDQGQSAASADSDASLSVGRSSSLVGSGLEQQAARILLGFLGAVQGSQYSVNAFLEELLSSYLSGWAAYDIYSALSTEDFLCGKSMFPIAAINGSAQINADIFGHWISTVYITLAQIGVPHKAQKDSVGWAWASPLKDADAVAANRLSHLVSTTLQSEAQEEGQPPAADSEALAAVKALPQASKLPKKGHDFAVLEDPTLSESSSAMGLMSQLLNLVTLTRSLAARTRRTEGLQRQ